MKGYNLKQYLQNQLTLKKIKTTKNTLQSIHPMFTYDLVSSRPIPGNVLLENYVSAQLFAQVEKHCSQRYKTKIINTLDIIMNINI